ncbi:MAG: flagellar motor switch protein FliM [Elusimicrobiota bacterium]
MSDILSQEEVDALLSAVSSGEIETAPVASAARESEAAGAKSEGEEKTISIYDFKRPDRVSKDQMRTLQNIHEGYARLFSTTLTSYLRSLVEIELISVDQLTYSEFIMSISNPSCIYIFQMEPLEGKAIFEVNPSLVFFMIDRLFGGQGKPSEQNRELTGIEENVMVKITDRALQDLRDVWKHIGLFSPRIENYETNPQFVQIAPPGETVILISLEVRMQNGSGLISLCLPYMLLEPIIDKLSGESWISSKKAITAETRKVVESEIEPMQVTVTAEIGTTKISVRDFLQLEKGDVISLEKKTNDDMIIKIGGVSKLRGTPGIIGRKRAVKIKSVFSREELCYGRG